MTSTVFVDNTTVVYANWLNDVNFCAYNILGNGTIVPATAAAARTNLGVPADSAVVHNTGNETVAGIKTFSSSPLVPDATTSAQVPAFHQIADGLAAAVITSGSDPTFANSSSSPASTDWIKGQRAATFYTTAPVATTSGTAVDIVTPGTVPPWATRITIIFNAVSNNGTNVIMLQVGTSGGYVTTGYSSSGGQSTNGGSPSVVNISTGLAISGNNSASDARCGHAVLIKVSGSNQWLFSSTTAPNAILSVGYGAGITPVLGGILDRIRVTSFGGTDTFDNGSISLLIE